MPIDFRVADFCHPRQIWRLRRTLERTQWLPADELKAYQDERLRAVVTHAATRVPYYRDLFGRLSLRPADIAGAADLARLPVLDKQVLRNRPEDLLADDAKRHGPRWHTTSGTTGTSVRFALDRAANVLEFCFYWRHWSWAGYRLGDRFAELGSAHFLLRRRRTDPVVHWQPHLRRLMLNSGQISPSLAPAMARAIRRRRPIFLKGMPSALYHLALCLQEAGIDDVSFRGVFTTGEVVTSAYRAVIERTFHCRVFDSYGHMERTVGIAQCEQGSYHVQSDYGLLELANRRESSDGVALARVRGTSLYNLAMPLLRYDVGDDVEVCDDPTPCPCGRTLPTVKAIHGRTQDTIVTPDGRFITSMFVLFDLVAGIRAAQIHRESSDSVAILVVPGREWDTSQRRALREQAETLFGPQMQVRLEVVGPADLVRDRSGKMRPVVGASIPVR